MDDVDLADGRSLVGGHRVQTLHDRRPARARVGQPRGQPRDRDAAADRAVVVEWPRSVSGTSLLVVGTSSIAANLTGWLLYTQRASESPTPIWIGVATAATLNAMMNPSRW